MMSDVQGVELEPLNSQGLAQVARREDTGSNGRAPGQRGPELSPGTHLTNGADTSSTRTSTRAIQGSPSKKPKLHEQHDIQQAVILRDKFVDALMWRATERLRGLVRQAAALKVSKDSLAVSGLGHLFADVEFRQFCGDGEAQMLEVVLARWKQSVMGQTTVATQGHKPLNGMKAGTYVTCVEEMILWLRKIDDDGGDSVVQKRLASILVLQNFKRWPQLEGVTFEDVGHMCASAAQRALLVRAVKEANMKGEVQRQRRQVIDVNDVDAAQDRDRVRKNAIKFADGLMPDMVKAAEEAVLKLLDDGGLQGLGTDLNRCRQLQLCTVRKSRARMCRTYCMLQVLC